MRSVFRAVLAAGLALAPAAGRAEVPVQVAPAGPWSAAFAGQTSPPEALAPLGLDAGSWPAFLRIMDRTAVSPQEALSAPDASTAAGLVKSAAAARLGRALADVTKLRGEKFLSPSRSLAKLHGELRDFRSVPAVVPWHRATTLLRASTEVTSALHRRAMREAEKRLRKAGGAAVAFDAEAIRRVEAFAEGAAADWTVADAVLGAFESQRGAMRAAIESPNLIGPEKLLAAAVLAPRQARLLALEYKLARSGVDGVEFARRTVAGGKPIAERDRAWLESLRGYVPGLDLSAAVATSPLLDDVFPSGAKAAGWAMYERSAAGRIRSFVWVSPGLAWLGRVHTAAHEGFHQGDAGYRKGRAALPLLLGDRFSGQALFTVLIEGYTEFRAREAMEAIFRDGLRDRSELATTVSRAILKKFGPTRASLRAPDAALEAWRRSLSGHGYTPYVELVKAILDRPRGRDALDAFVLRGELGPLVAALGSDRLEALGRIGSAYYRASGWLDFHRGRYPKSREARASDALGLPAWLERKMIEVVQAGPQAADGADAAARLALRTVEDRVKPLGSRAAMRALERIGRGRVGRERLDRAARSLARGEPRRAVAAELSAALASVEREGWSHPLDRGWLGAGLLVGMVSVPGLAEAAALGAPLQWLWPRIAVSLAAWLVFARLWTWVQGALFRRSFLAHLLDYLPKDRRP